MFTLITLFVLALLAMVVIPLRHLSRVRSVPITDDGATKDKGESIARVPIVTYLGKLERWYQYSAKSKFLQSLDEVLRVFERTMGRVAGETKKARIMIQERFRVIPRESLYWKNIHSWKRTNGAHNSSDEMGEGDISNHVED